MRGVINLSIQVLQYEFLGPVPLSEWGPPMEKTVYLVMAKKKDTFSIVYAGDCKKTQNPDFFTKNERFKCWLECGMESSLYVAIYPMFERDDSERDRLVEKIISRYRPACNQ